MISEKSSLKGNGNAEIPALIETLFSTEQRLEELTAGEVDAVVARDGRSFMLLRGQEHFRHSEAGKQAGILDSLPAHIALLDTQGVIVSVNEAWRRFANANVLNVPGHGVGLNYLTICDRAVGAYSSEAHQVAEGIRGVLSGSEQSFSIEYPCHSLAEQRWFLLTVTPLAEDRSSGVVVMHLNITERKRAEETFRFGEERLRVALLASRTGTFRWDLRTDELNWDSSLDALFGRPQGQTICSLEVFIALVHPDDRRDVIERCERCAREGADFDAEFRVVWPDGSLHWLDDKGKTFFDAAGRPLYMTGACVDITDRKLAEMALRESELRLGHAMRMAQLVAWEYDPATALFTFDDRYYVLHNTTAALQGGNLMSAEAFARKFVHPDDACLVVAELGKAVATTDPDYFKQLECRILRRDGEVRHVLVRISITKDIAGRTVQVYGASQDITERKRARAQRERLANMVEASPDFIGFADPKTTQLLYVNKHGRRMCGIGEDEPLEMLKIGDVHPAWMNQRFADLILPAAVRDGVWEGEGAFLHRDGREIPVSMVLMASKAPNGEVDIFYTVSRDITERKKLEARLRQGQKMEAIGTLAGGIAHDFNNILAAIMGYTELALKGVTENGRAHGQLEQVLKASARARDLVRQILAFSRHEEHEQEALQLQDVIRETLKLLQASLPATIEFRQNIDRATPRILGDATQIQQVIMNLCVNAGQAMKGRNGILEISLGCAEDDAEFRNAHPELEAGPHVCLSVRDTGCGFEPEVQDRIFDPFFTTKAPGEGTGLGLAVVHGIVKKHGGAITVHSERGVGTTFSLYLPAYFGSHEAAVNNSDAVSDGNGEHILFVDDEEALVSLGKIMLGTLGYRVTTTTNSVEALATFRAHPDDFDLVITDQTMPHLNGGDLAKAILQIRPAIPVILTSGYSAVLTPEMAIEIGIREFLAKPTTMQTLGEAIQRSLGTAQVIK